MNDTDFWGTALRTQVAVVIPCYNAGERLLSVVLGAREFVDTVIVVDDGSTDGAPTSLPADTATVLSFEANRGKGFALLEGFRHALDNARINCVAVIDADGQHDPRELPRLYRAFREQNADLLIGARRFDLEHVPLRSRLGNTLSIELIRSLLGQHIADTQSGYRLHSRRFLEDVLRTVEGGRYETETEILVKAVLQGYRVICEPIQTLYEMGNPSSHFRQFSDSVRIYRRLLRAVRKFRSGAPRSETDRR